LRGSRHGEHQSADGQVHGQTLEKLHVDSFVNEVREIVVINDFILAQSLASLRV
jgi:hypothetical protein